MIFRKKKKKKAIESTSIARLEHTNEVIVTHYLDKCPEKCPLHKRTNHHLRDLPQVIQYVGVENEDALELVFRKCEHGNLLPDPDNFIDDIDKAALLACVHECNCCLDKYIISEGNK